MVATTFAVAIWVGVPAVILTLVGIMVQEVTLAVPPAQVRFTVPVKPPLPVTVTGIAPETPLVRLAVAGAVTAKVPVAAVPVPVSATATELGAVPMVNVAVSAPAGTNVGVKITPMVQVPVAASGGPQGVAVPAVAAAKSPALAPVTAKATGRVPVELLVTVTDIAALGILRVWLPKASGLGVAVRVEPVPVNATATVLGAVPTVRVAASVPTTVGVNMTPMVEVPAAASGAPQGVAVPAVAATKSPAFAPVTAKVTGRGPVELLVTVTVIAALGVLSGWVPKASGLGVAVRVAINGSSATKALTPVAFFVAV